MNPPENLNKLIKIPEADIESGRHNMAECYGGTLADRCRNPVRYKMAYEEPPFDDGNYNTAYWCEAHKPEESQ